MKQRIRMTMSNLRLWFGLAAASVSAGGFACAVPADNAPADSPALKITDASVRHYDDLGVLVFELQTEGRVGSVAPSPAGKMDGAPVVGYVFPTTLSPEEVGFGATEGILALAVTAHPDFDDTPLWDESMDGVVGNDGAVWHPHWVVLQPDERIGALAVKQFKKGDATVTLPQTNPGMPMYMDSPGFGVWMRDDRLKVTVPLYRTRGKKDFKFDAVAVYMEVNASDDTRPMLGVYKVYSVASGDLSLPYSVEAARLGN